jgi:hypothetical protein
MCGKVVRSETLQNELHLWPCIHLTYSTPLARRFVNISFVTFAIAVLIRALGSCNVL